MSRSWKIHIVSFQDFLQNSLLILFNNVFCYCEALNNNSKKWLLLDAKKKIFNVKKIIITPKLDVFQKKFPRLISVLILFVINNILSVQTNVFKKYCLWTLFLAKCSECDVWWQGLFKICTCVCKPSSHLLVISWNFQERNIILTLLKLQIIVVNTVFYHPNCLICTE